MRVEALKDLGIEGFRLDAKGVLGVDITYDQARRGREKAIKLLQGNSLTMSLS